MTDRQVNLRAALAQSPHYNELVAELPVLALALHAPLSFDGWTDDEMAEGERYARDGGAVPPKIEAYVARVRRGAAGG